MKLEIYFHNSYHIGKQEQKTEIVPPLPPDEDYDDPLHYPELKFPEPNILLTQLDYSDHRTFEIKDNNNEIKCIETNNPRCIKINTKIKKGLFKKIKIYTITSTGNGNIKIHYKNRKEPEIRPIFCNSCSQNIKLGSLSGHDPDYWLKKDPFIGNKYVDCLYSYSTNTTEIENHINLCYKMGAECKFVFQKMRLTELDTYIIEFKNYIETISNLSKNYKGMKCTIIYEPDFLSDIYNSGNRNPHNIYLDNGNSLVQFITEIEEICNNGGIEFVQGFTFSMHKVTDIIDFDRYLTVLKNKSKQIAEYLDYFKKSRSKYIAFSYIRDYLMSNDEHLAYLFMIKCILEHLQLEGILFGIPVGHINSLKDTVSIHTNKMYESHTDKPGDYQSTATLFFFGGNAMFNNEYFFQNKFKDTGLTINGNICSFTEHISLAYTFNIKYLMFGPITVEDTTNVPLNSRGNKCTDHNYTITKIMEYMKHL